jgi:hypothetical protein
LLQRAIEMNTGHFLLWLELGRCQQAMGLLGPARNSFTQAKQLNPRCEEAGRALGQLAGAGLSSRVRGLWRRIFF